MTLRAGRGPGSCPGNGAASKPHPPRTPAGGGPGEWNAALFLPALEKKRWPFFLLKSAARLHSNHSGARFQAPKRGRPVWHVWHTGTLPRSWCAKNSGTSGTLARCSAVNVPKFRHARHAGTLQRGQCAKIPARPARRHTATKLCAKIPARPTHRHTFPRPRASVPTVPGFLARLRAAACQRANCAGILAQFPAAACQCANCAGILAHLPAAACPRANCGGRVPACQLCRNFGTPPRGRVPMGPTVPEFWHTSPRPRASVLTVPEFWHTSPRPRASVPIVPEF